MADQRQPLDTSIEIVTPENIAFRYRLAGPFRRLPAYLIDFVVRTAVLGVCLLAALFALGSLGLAGTALGIIAVAWFISDWFYGGLFETFWNGQTPGKRLMGIRVVSVDGLPIAGWQAVLRNVLRAIDAQPLLSYQLGFWTSMMNDRFQRLGDLASGTMVVVEQRHRLQKVMPSGERETAKMAALIPANFTVSRTLGLALSGYVARRKHFSWARRMEIAHHVGDPLRQKFGLPHGTNLDLLLCGLYERTFLADHEAAADGQSPFREPGTGPFFGQTAFPSAKGSLTEKMDPGTLRVPSSPFASAMPLDEELPVAIFTPEETGP